MNSTELGNKLLLAVPGRKAGITAVAIAVAAINVMAVPAQAQALEIGTNAEGSSAIGFTYSSDGVTYSNSVPELFENTPKLVPGQGLERMLWVRNGNSTAMNVSVSALESVAERGRAQVELTPSSAVTVEPGATAPLRVWISLPEHADNSSQGQTWPVTLKLNINEKASADSNELGFTGAMVGIWPISVAALLGGAAAYFGVRKRNRQA